MVQPQPAKRKDTNILVAQGKERDATAIKAEYQKKRWTCAQSSLVANMTFNKSVTFIFFCHQLKGIEKGDLFSGFTVI